MRYAVLALRVQILIVMTHAETMANTETAAVLSGHLGIN